MRITWNELTVRFDPNKTGALLEDWRWLVGDNVELVLASTLGDLFLRHTDGRILWLDTGAACFTQVADSFNEFKRLMQQTENANKWFMPQLIGDLIVNGKRLKSGQCYSYKLPPMLNGEIALDNFEPADLLVHCSLFGQIGRQIQHLPEGTKIDGFTTTNDG